MNSLTVSVSSGTILADSVVVLPLSIVKGQTGVILDLTGIDESQYAVASIDLNWGDGSKIEYLEKDLVVDYTKSSIIDEILYGKPIGSVATLYNHVYNTQPDQAFTTYQLLFTVYCENGYIVNYSKDITVYPESFYDSVKDLKLISTQIIPTSDNFTVANFEGANGYSFASVLDIEPLIISEIATNLTAPNIIGNPWNNQLLSASPGAWTRNPYEYGYQWRVNGSNIDNANSQTWVTLNIFDQDLIDVTVFAVTDGGSSDTKSSNKLVGLEIPSSLSIPILSGIPILGSTLSSTYGLFGGSTSIQTLQWQKNGVDISGATSNTLVVNSISPNHGDLIRSRVIASNVVGSISAFSLTKSIVLAPVWLSGGFISGTSTPGGILTATDPTWTNDATSTREWYRNSIGTGATGSTFSNTSGGDSVYVRFVGHNIAGDTAPVQSNTIMLQEIPTNITIPEIGGDPWWGGVVTSTPGTWTFSPTSYLYQWTNNGFNLSGQSSSFLVVSSAIPSFVLGDNIGLKVTAINIGGASAPESSNTIEYVLIHPTERSALYYTTSAVTGVYRTAIVTLDNINEVGSMYFRSSSFQGSYRLSQLTLDPQGEMGSMYFESSSFQGSYRLSEIDVNIDESTGLYFSPSAFRGTLI